MAEVILKNIGKAYDNGYEAVKNVNRPTGFRGP